MDAQGLAIAGAEVTVTGPVTARQVKMMTDETGVLLAARSEKGFNTFPAFQRMSETTINNCCAELTGFPLDYVRSFCVSQETASIPREPAG